MNIHRFLKSAAGHQAVDNNRRSFLKVSAGTSAGLMLGVSFNGFAVAQSTATEAALELNAFVSNTG